MSRAANCGLDQSLYPSEFLFNEVAAILMTIFTLMTGIIYFWNVLTLCCDGQTPGEERRYKHERYEFAVNPQSGLLASVVGIVLIFATWPQPLEASASLLVVFAQASVLGWQDHDPENRWKDLLEKAPDVIAVIVGAYALGDARSRYLELSKNEFFKLHDPKKETDIAYSLAAISFAIGFMQEILVTRRGLVRATQKLIRMLHRC